MTTPKYYNETVGVSIFVQEGHCKDVKLSYSVGAFLNFMIFPKISRHCHDLVQIQDLLETLGEVYTINFLIVMLDLKLRIKAGTLKNRYNRISEWSLAT